MSWLDRVKTGMLITTGDGKTYKPLWRVASRSKEYNTSVFEFPEVEGSLVHRGKAQAYKYNLEFYFQGDDHLDVSANFSISADDSRAWKISHPLYGSLTVHPLSISTDNTDGNITKFNIPILETIIDTKPTFSLAPVDKIIALKEQINTTMSGAFVNNVKQVSVSDINRMKSQVNAFYQLGKNINKTAEQAQDYFNLFNNASAKLNSAIISPLVAVQAMQDVINAPSQFADSVTNRIKMFNSQLDILINSIDVLSGKSNKNIYEHNGGMVVSSMAVVAVTDFSYKSREDVLVTMDQISTAYDNYLNTIDIIQDDNDSSIDKYVPTVDSQLQLADLILFTVGSLINIAVSAKQERIVYLEKDSNVILLAHRFYGLVTDDSTIDQFIAQNKIGLNELLQIKKGRKLSYFV